MRLWDLKGQELAQFTHTGSVFSVAFSPDGRKIASISDDNTVRLWDLKGQELAQFTHTSSVLSVTFSPDGRKIASASDDNTVRLWDLKGQELAQFTHTSSVLSVAFSPDGRKIVSISDDNTVRLWESNSTNLLSLACNRLQYHSVLLKAETEDALAAGNACLKYSNWNNHEKAEFQRDRGLALSRKSNYSQGAIDLKAAQKRNSKIDLNPDTKQRETEPNKVAQQLAAQTILLDAIALAKQNKRDEAIERFKQAQTIYPQIDLNPDTKELDRDPEQVAARVLLPIKGIPLAKRERIEEALDRTLGNIPADSAVTNDGIKINSPTPVFRIVDNALYFDRIKDCVKVPDNPALNFGTGDFSISIWIKTTDRSGIDPILDKRIETSGPIQGYHLFNYQGRLGLQLADGTSWNNYHSNILIVDGRWHQVTVSIDRDSPSGGKWYVDGQLVDSFNPTSRIGSLSNSAPLTFGRNSDNPVWPGYFNGILDEVMLFDRSLSPSQVRKLYYDSLNLGLTSNKALVNFSY